MKKFYFKYVPDNFVIDLKDYRQLRKNWPVLKDRKNEQYFTLRKYESLLSSHLKYDRRKWFMNVFYFYFAEEINLTQFMDQFLNLFVTTNKDSTILEKSLLDSPLILFECHYKCRDLERLFGTIVEEGGELFNEDSTDKDRKLYQLIQETFQELNNILNL